MKKAILFLAAAVSATALFGAPVEWSANPLGGQSSSDDLTKYTIYFIQDTTADDVAAAISGGTFADLTKTTGTITGNTNARTGVTTYSASGSATTSHTDEDGDYSSVLVMFNADGSYYTAMEKTAAVSVVSSTASFGFNRLGQSGTTTWTAVPEPASMALLLLGAAAFGLKRKRA